MRRMVFLSGAVSFAMAFLGTLVASTVIPAVVGAQEAGIRVEQLSIVGDNGADRIRLTTRPGINASVGVRDANGIPRASFNTGRAPYGDAPEAAGFNVWATDGTTGLIRLGTGGRGPGGDQPLATVLALSDWQGQNRIVLRVAEDGTAFIRILDASGNVTWEATNQEL